MKERISIATPDHVDLEFELAGAGSRFVAFVIDMLLIAVSMVAVVIALLLFIGNLGAMARSVSTWGLTLLVVVQFALTWGYFFVFEVRGKGQTPGKRHQGIRVVRDDGLPIGWKESALRNLVRAVDMLPPPACLVAATAVSLSPTGKRLGDMLAGTIVVRETFGSQTRDRSGALWEAAWVVRIESGRSKQAVTLPHGTIDAPQIDLIEQFLTRKHTLAGDQRDALAWKIAEPLLPLMGEDREATSRRLDRTSACEEILARIVELARAGGSAQSETLREAAAMKRQQWIEFEAEIDALVRRRRPLQALSSERLTRLIEDYGRLTSDLARARSIGGDTDVAFHLNRIAVKAHALLYGHLDAVRPGRTTHWLFRVPVAVRSQLPAVFLSALLLFGSAAVAFCAVQWNPALAYDLVPDVFLDFQPARAESMHDIPSLVRPVAASQIITNNIAVTLMTFAFGLTAGIGTSLLLISNGILLGSVAGWMMAQGRGGAMWGWIMPHGGLELLAITLAGGAGFVLARAIAAPGEWRRTAALADAAPDALTITIGSIVMLLFAGCIEGFVSPSSIGFPARIAVLAVTLSAALLYLALPARGRD